MRWALITDIHGNREALEACLDAIGEEGADRIVCLGDVVGYGPDPVAVVDIVADLVRDGAICLKGNHDAAIATGTGQMSELAAAAIAWTTPRLGAAEKAFLDDLPLAVEEAGLLFVHASAADPARWTYVIGAEEAAASLAATEARVTFCGHTHVPAHFNTLSGVVGATGKTVTFRPVAGRPIPLSPIRRHLAVIGSVGQPRDRDPRACWALFDDHAGDLTWHRVPYDIAAVARKIDSSGLPTRLGARLFEGR